MAREIQRTRRTQTVSPSGTASRMGVVDVYTPNISQMFNVAADTMNNLAENQIKILDAKWQNNFETETTKYLNNKVDSILKSGEKPDLTRFQEEADGYINGVLSNVPERLSIGAEAYFNQKNLNAFETLRKQANIIEYQELTNSYEKNLESTLLNVDTFIENNFLTSRNPQESIDGINNFFATQVTAFLGSHGEKYNAMKIASEFKLNDGTQREAEQGLLLSLEQKRVNAIVKSFYQNIDITDPQQVANAENEAQMFLRNYSLNEGGVRGVNYEIFEDETGNKIGQDIIDKIVDNGIKRFNTIKSLNEFEINKIRTKKLTEDSLQIESITNSISDVTKPMIMGENIYTEGDSLMSPQGFRDLLDSKGIVYNTSDITDLVKKNQDAFFLRQSTSDYFSGKSESDLSEILSSKENQDRLTSLGLTSKEYIGGVISEFFPEVEDTLEGYMDLINRPNEANVLFTFMRENETLTNGAKQLMNTMNSTKLFDLLDEKNEDAINQWFDTAVPVWNSLTDGGIVSFEGINKNTNEMFSFFNGLKEFYDPITLAKEWKENQEIKQKNLLTKESGGVIALTAPAKEFFNEIEGMEGYSVTSNFLNKEFDRVRSKQEYSAFFPMRIVVETSESAKKEIERLYDPEYIKNLDALVYEQAKMLTSIEVGPNTNPDIVSNIFEQNVAKVMTKLVNEDDFGTTRFAPNSGEKYTFAKDALEKVHKLDEYTAINHLSSFTYMYVENNYDTDENLRNAFQINGIETKPTQEDLYQLAEQGGLEVERIDGTDDYRVKLNLDFSKKFDRYGYADDSISIKVNGKDFNPSEMFNTSFQTYVEKRTQDYLDTTDMDPYIMRPLVNKFMNSMRTVGIPFDDTNFNLLQKDYQDKLIDVYEETANDYAFSFSNIITNTFKQENESDRDFLLRQSVDIHNAIFEEAAMPDSFGTLEENVDAVMDMFSKRLETKPGQVAFILDAYNLYKPDLKKLKSAIRSGNVKKLHSLFPEMGDMQKRVLTYLFSPEYYETN